MSNPAVTVSPVISFPQQPYEVGTVVLLYRWGGNRSLDGEIMDSKPVGLLTLFTLFPPKSPAQEALSSGELGGWLSGPLNTNFDFPDNLALSPAKLSAWCGGCKPWRWSQTGLTLNCFLPSPGHLTEASCLISLGPDSFVAEQNITEESTWESTQAMHLVLTSFH